MSRERNGGSSFRATRSPTYSRSRSRSYSRDRRRSPSPTSRRRSPSPRSSRGGRPNGGSRSRDRPGFQAERINPEPSTVLGVFGLSPHTREKDLKEAFSKYGKITQARLIIDKRTMKSRGFGFVYFDNVDDAQEAKRKCHGMDLDGKAIRVDFSIGERDYSQLPSGRGPPPSYHNHHHSYHSSRPSYHHSRSRYSPYGSPPPPSYYGGYHRGGPPPRERDSPVYSSSKRYSRSRSRSYDRHYHRRSSSYRR